jgi:hypothetical protein
MSSSREISRVDRSMKLRNRRACRPEVGKLESRTLLSTIYSNDFQTGSTAGWNGTTVPAITTAPMGQKFLGEFNNDTESLSVLDTQPHTQITLSFDLYILRTWDGNGPLILQR